MEREVAQGMNDLIHNVVRDVEASMVKPQSKATPTVISPQLYYSMGVFQKPKWIRMKVDEVMVHMENEFAQIYVNELINVKTEILVQMYKLLPYTPPGHIATKTVNMEETSSSHASWYESLSSFSGNQN